MKHNFHKLKAILKQQIKIWRIRRHFSQIQKKHTKGSFLNLKPQSCKRFASVAVAITIILSIVAFIPAMQTPHTKAAWYATGGTWNYRKQITFTSDAAKIPSTQADFPVLISITDAGLASHAQDDGDDILFTSSDQLTKLSHEIESFDGTTGALVAWVKVPSLAASGSIYLYYGEDDIASQQNAPDVWSNGYKGVWHLSESSWTADGTGGAKDAINSIRVSSHDGWAMNSAAIYDDPIMGRVGNFTSTANVSSSSPAHINFSNIQSELYFDSDAVPYTIQGWFRGETAWDSYLLSYGNGESNSNKDYYIRTLASNGGVRVSAGGNSSDINTNFLDNAWHQVSLVNQNNGGTYQFKGFVDGGTSTTDWANSGAQRQLNGGFKIACRDWTWGGNAINGFKGYMNEIRVSNVARSADWITVEYANQNDPSTFYAMGTEVHDTVAPSNPSNITALYSAGGAAITNNSGFDSTPYFSWPAAETEGGASDPGDVGVAGYYSYFGTSCGGGGADPASSRGVLSDTGGGLHYSADTNISVPDLTTNQGTYCLRLKTKDNAGNIQSTVWQAFTYKYDTTAPDAPTFVSANPAGYSTTDSFTLSWPAAADNGVSGLQGYQYKRGGSSGDDWSAIQTGASASGITSYQSGENIFLIRSVDNAGNTSSDVQTTFYFSNSAPTKPTALVATPDLSDTNAFAFSWTAPVHAVDIEEYGYSVNAYPTAQNLTWTGSSSTSLPEDSYATVQGENTIYLVAKDVSGAYALDAANVASLTFNCQTAAPPIPASVSISDSSNRAYSTYSLTIKWSAGAGQGLSFDHYLIQRSTDGSTFSDLATTSSAAYIDVSGLSNTTTYYYRIKAVDDAGSVSASSTIVSRIPTGKYDTPPTILQGPTDTDVKSTEATISWVTNRASTAGVRFGTNPNNLSRSQIDPTEQTEHTITIPGLEGGTKYYYEVQSLDNERDYSSEDAYSETAEFTTLALPAISDVKISNITLSTAELSWTTSAASNATLSYGKSISYGSSWSDTTSFTTNHTYKFTELDHSSSYHFKITGTDEDGNQIISDDYVFDTLPMPKISAVNFETDLKETQPKSYITWTTNVPTTSSVDYTPKNGSVTYEESQSSFVTSHKVELSKLSDNTSYSFFVYGSDQFGNRATSDEYSFSTPFDSRAAVISNISTETSNVGLNKQDKSQIVISWNTDEPATSQVEYSKGLAGDQYTQRTAEDHNFSTSHLVIISDLEPNTPYHFRAVSHDKGTNLSQSEDQFIIAGEIPKSVFSIITETFENIFGWLGKLI